MFEGEFHEGVASVNPLFLADIIAVAFDRARADEKLLRDLFAGFVIRDQREHSAFGRRQPLQT